jgi:predicted RND superfamily exporter protein
MEWNFLNLEPEGLRSVELQYEIVEKFKLSTTASILTTSSIEESRELRKKFKDRAVVGEVDDISLWISRPDFEESRQHIASLRDELGVMRELLPLVPHNPRTGGSPDVLSTKSVSECREMLAQELDRLWANLVEIQALSFIAGQDRVVEKTTQLVATRDSREKGLLRNAADRFADPHRIDWPAIDRFSIAFSGLLRDRVLRMTRGDDPVILEMVPERIRARYTSPTLPGFLMTIMPKKSLYEKEDLELFQEVATNIHPNITGDPQLILNMNLATIREGSQAFMASVALILLVLLIDFRRPLIAGLAFLPLVSGIGLLLGLMWILGEKINYINMIALPVIIGIGVDDGVHFFHRLIQEGRGGLRRAVASVGRGMLMSSLTTMIGFGSLMLYLMRGMASMGLVLFLGVGTCLLVTFTLLPALASLFEENIIKERTMGGRDVAAKKPSWTNP